MVVKGRIIFSAIDCSFRLDYSFPYLSGKDSTRSGLNITTVNINY